MLARLRLSRLHIGPGSRLAATDAIDKVKGRRASAAKLNEMLPSSGAATAEVASSTPQEEEKLEDAPPPAVNHLGSARTMGTMLHRTIEYRIYVKATRNNTILSFTKPNGNVVLNASGGLLGFKGANRASYEAGYACALRILQRVAQEQQTETLSLHILLSGFGQAREAIYRALLTDDADSIRKIVSRVSDRTPIAIGGTRPKKTRRL